VSCRGVRGRLSAYLDGELRPLESQRVDEHLRGCGACAAHLASLRCALEDLADLPRLGGGEEITSRVFDRLEMEDRGPAFAALFRTARSGRPMILPSLLGAGLVLAVIFGGIFALGRPEPLPEVHVVQGQWPPRLPAWGTESNPLVLYDSVNLPRARPSAASSEALAGMGEGTLFLETVVARDGSVSNVTLLEGDLAQAQPLLDALRRQRFEPVIYRGRPVAVSLYRLISHLEVRSPTS
jgi:hypothetical protein